MANASQLIRETFQKEFEGKKDDLFNYGELYRQRLIFFRREKHAVVRIEKPTNIPRARSLGYKAKKGIVVARVRVRKGSGLHRRPNKGRKPKRMGVNKLTRKKSIQAIAEQKASNSFPNLEVLNSYWIGEDGQKKYFEVILVDPFAPEIASDSQLSWIASGKHWGRAERGKTSANKKHRGLRGKGRGHEKNRPSLRAHDRKAK